MRFPWLVLFAGLAGVARAQPDTTVVPPLDHTRAIDAELRAALFDLTTGSPVAALTRLRAIDPKADPTARGFLIAQCFYRLGMDDSLAATVAALANTPDAARVQPVLQAQLQMAGYRDGTRPLETALAASDPTHLRAAQNAYEAGDYDRAVAAADSVRADGPFGAAASLTAAWALYRSGKIAQAGERFGAFARAYPDLPERDEARLIEAQSALALRHDDEATRAFRAVIDAPSAPADPPNGGRLLVAARAADLLLLGDIAGGKAVAFPDSAMSGIDVLRAAVSGGAPAAPPVPAPDSVISIDQVRRRLAAAGTPWLARAVFRTTPDSAARDSLGRALAAVRAADVGVALAERAIQRQGASAQARVADLQRLKAGIRTPRDTTAGDSLSRVLATVDADHAKVHRLLLARITDMRDLSQENVARLDTVRRAMPGGPRPDDVVYLAREQGIAQGYRRLADRTATGLDSAIARHPVFVLEDSVRKRGARIRTLLAETRVAGASATGAIDSAITREQSGASPERVALRAALTAAQSRRDAAVARLVPIVDRALAARVAALAADRRRDLMAAEFGAASAAFFRYADASRGNPDTAIAALTLALARYPESPLRPGALYELGELLTRRADDRFAATQRGDSAGSAHPDYAEPVARYEELVKRYPTFPEIAGAAYTLGTLYSFAHRYANAIPRFELVAAHPQAPQRPEALFRLGDAQFEMAAGQRGDPRLASLRKAITAYEGAVDAAPKDGDVYFLSLYKLGWAHYNTATAQDPGGYNQAVDVFGRLVDAYDALPPERQQRLGLRGEALGYMAVSFAQIGGAAAADRFFAARADRARLQVPVLRQIAVRLRDQGDFPKAVAAYQELLSAAPDDSSALGTSRAIVDLYQNHTLEPEKAQAARLSLVQKFAPGALWTAANPTYAKEAAATREAALRQSAQFQLAKAQSSPDQRAHYDSAASLYRVYMADYGQADSARIMDIHYADALFGAKDYRGAATAYGRAAFDFPSDSTDPRNAQAAQNAIVAWDSVTAHDKADRAVQDSLFSALDRYADRYPRTDIARKALIAKGRRAADGGQWDVEAETFRRYATLYPTDPYAATAAKQVGDALYKQGRYPDAQRQWDSAAVVARATGRAAFADSIAGVQHSAATAYADSLVKRGAYDQAVRDVYVPIADRSPGTEQAADALRNAIETYLLADTSYRPRAAALAQRLVTEYPQYRYRLQYQMLYSDLLLETRQSDQSIAVLRAVVADNPGWRGRADAEIKLAVRLDSLRRRREAAAVYEQFAADYPADKRAADAQYNAGVTYLEAGDTVAGAKAYGTFAQRFPRDPRIGRVRVARVRLLRATGDTAAARVALDPLCDAVAPPPELRGDCAARAGRRAFDEGVALFQKYKDVALVIPTRAELTAAGVRRASARKQEMLAAVARTFTKAIRSGDPRYLAAGSFYVGYAQWVYGDFLAHVSLPAGLSDSERDAAMRGAAQQAQGYYTQARQTWQALVDKAAPDGIVNGWVDLARQGTQGTVPARPPLDTEIK